MGNQWWEKEPRAALLDAVDMLRTVALICNANEESLGKVPYYWLKDLDYEQQSAYAFAEEGYRRLLTEMFGVEKAEHIGRVMLESGEDVRYCIQYVAEEAEGDEPQELWVEERGGDDAHGPFGDEMEASEYMDEHGLSDDDWKLTK